MHHPCSFFPLQETERLRRNWCGVNVDVDSDGNISVSSLRRQIASHPCFSSSSQLNLTLYNVTDMELIRLYLECDLPIARDHLKEAARISPTDKLPVRSCEFVIAVDTPLPFVPTQQSVSAEQLPVLVELSLQTEVSPQTSEDIDLLGKIAISAKATEERSARSIFLSMEDCKHNNIQERKDVVPDAPDWLKSFVKQMSRRR